VPLNLNEDVYIGDGLTVRCDGFGIGVSCMRDGREHVVFFEPQTYRKLGEFITGLPRLLRSAYQGDD
jgi:hypothetical protein